jgi:hypothetical protein
LTHLTDTEITKDSGCTGDWGKADPHSGDFVSIASQCKLTIPPKYGVLIIPVSDSKAGNVSFDIFVSSDSTEGTKISSANHTPALSITTNEIPILNRPLVKQITIKVTAGGPLRLSQFNFLYVTQHSSPTMACSRTEIIDNRYSLHSSQYDHMSNFKLTKDPEKVFSKDGNVFTVGYYSGKIKFTAAKCPSEDADLKTSSMEYTYDLDGHTIIVPFTF